MAIVISRNNFGRPLPEEEQQQLNLTENRAVAQTLERVLMRISREANADACLRTDGKQEENTLKNKIIGKNSDS